MDAQLAEEVPDVVSHGRLRQPEPPRDALHGLPVGKQPDRLLGLSPAADQARAGLLMMIEQLATFGTAAFLLLATRLGRPSGARRQSGAGVAAGRGC